MEHEGAHKAEADVLAALLVLDSQVERYEDLPRTIPELHNAMEYPDIVDPDGKFVRREDGVIVFALDHRARPWTTWHGPTPVSWNGCSRKTLRRGEAVAREALERTRAQLAVPIHVD